MKQRTRLTILDGAQEDYDEAFHWYHRRDRRAARTFERAIEKALSAIIKSPLSWPYYDDTYRHFVLQVFPLSILYRLENRHVVVVAIAHGSREEGYWRDRVE